MHWVNYSIRALLQLLCNQFDVLRERVLPCVGCPDILPTVTTPVDVVVRALPGSDRATWDTLHSEVASAIGKAVGKR